ncbi:MAG: family 43 glycosylhydrolase [Bacteroidales bacterium]|nr:family 43 glycosylhydrolase [Bacteroidales bacterium]
MRVKLIVVMGLVFDLFMAKLTAQTYTNPFYLPNEWERYGVGDPYILKYRGVYYLYSSTKDGYVGIKVYSSRDLISWQYRGFCTQEPITKTAYAPEVVYWNGKFYMYTSPAGNGHYVLMADNPLGPFSQATNNFGHSIDGSVFIDDDEQWYFYHAGSTIQGCRMSSPTIIGNAVSMGVTIANGWTEGPCVFKRNGIYYMIYTGNHVWSKGYRINYALNKTSPFSIFTPDDNQNPILLNSEGSWYGLGHGSVFIGPDLDSYYIVYHNFGPEGVPYRHLNFDRITWNGDLMQVLGPTNFPQPSPELPRIYDYFNGLSKNASWSFSSGGSWLRDSINECLTQSDLGTRKFFAVLDSSTFKSFTAEFNLKLNSASNASAYAGIFYNFIDTGNYSALIFFGDYQTIVLRNYQNNIITNEIPIVFLTSMDFRVWHTIKLKKDKNKVLVFIDNLKKIEIDDTTSTGKVGYLSYMCSASYGYFALSNKVNGSGDFDAYKPLPGKIVAVHYISAGPEVGYHDNTKGNFGGAYRNDDVDIFPDGEGGFKIGQNESGEWYAYNVNVQYTSEYMAGIKYTSLNGAKIKIFIDDIDVSGEILLPSANKPKIEMFKTFSLQKGFHKLTIKTIEGSFDFYSIKFEKYTEQVTQKGDNFDLNTFNASWNYSDGNWIVKNGAAFIDGFGKRTMGGTGWSNYVIDVDVKYSNQMNAGVIFRVQNPANGGAGDDPVLGTDFLQGYFVGLNQNAIVLGKHNYNWTLLKSVSGSYQLNKAYHLKIIVKKNTIKVYVDNASFPVLEYTDDIPFMTGKVGIRSHNTSVYFDNFMVQTFIDSVPSKVANRKYNQDEYLRIFPNPAIDSLNLSSVIPFDIVEIYDANGVRVSMFKNIKGVLFKNMNIKELSKGTYILKVKTSTNDWLSTSFVKL